MLIHSIRLYQTSLGDAEQAMYALRMMANRMSLNNQPKLS